MGRRILTVGPGPRPEGCSPRLGDLMVLVRLSSAGADGADHSPAVVQWYPSGEDHNPTLIAGGDPEERLAGFSLVRMPGIALRFIARRSWPTSTSHALEPAFDLPPGLDADDAVDLPAILDDDEQRDAAGVEPRRRRGVLVNV